MKDPAAAQLGKKGGVARKLALSPERRRQIARLAGLASGRVRQKKKPFVSLNAKLKEFLAKERQSLEENSPETTGERPAQP